MAGIGGSFFPHKFCGLANCLKLEIALNQPKPAYMTMTNTKIIK